MPRASPSVLRRALPWLMPLLVFLVLALTALSLFLIPRLSRSPVSSGPFDASALGGNASDAAKAELNQMVLGHVEVLGGAAFLENLRSIRLAGLWEEADERLPVRIFLELPDRGLRTLHPEGQPSRHHVYNGPIAGQRIDSSGGPELHELSRANGRMFIIGTRPLNPLARLALGSKGRITSMDTTEYNGRMGYDLRIVQPDGVIARCFLDRDTLLVLRTVEQRTLGGRQEVIERRMGDFRAADGLVYPHESELWRNGQRRHRIEMTSVTVNPNTFPKHFRLQEENSRLAPR